jgi:hypothetical protein
MSIRFPVLKYQGGLARHGCQIEGVLHEEYDVNVVRFSLGGDERSKNDKTRQLPGGGCELVNAVQTVGHGTTLDGTSTEAFQNIRQRRLMDAGWKIPVFIERR